MVSDSNLENKDFREFLRKVGALREKRDVSGVLSVLDAGDQRFGVTTSSLHCRAQAYIVLGDFCEAQRLIGLGLEIAPDDFYLLSLNASLYHTQGYNEAAMILIESLLQTDSRSVFVLKLKGRVCLDLGLYDEAISCFNLLLSMVPGRKSIKAGGGLFCLRDRLVLIEGIILGL